MTQAILISIQSQHVLNILNGSKTLELRKSVPKGYVGWVYIYETLGKWRNACEDDNYDELQKTSKIVYHRKGDRIYQGRGQVVARFWFDEYETLKWDIVDYRRLGWEGYFLSESKLKQLCLRAVDVDGYGMGKDLYAWHIKKLEVFDKPMQLREFYQFKKKWVHSGMDCPPYVDEVKTSLTKAPQSWQYVWVKENV